MHGVDLPPEALAKLHHRADRDYHQQLLDRLRARGVPEIDLLYLHVRAALLTVRDLAVALSDGLPKG